MQYVIMSDGKGTRWNNYLNITKQEIVIDGENLLERIVRQIKNFDRYAKIIISSHNPNHKVDGCVLYASETENNYKRMYLYEKISEPTVFLYGDTYYEDNVIEKIVNDLIEKVMFYGNENAIIAVKVIDYNLFKSKLDIYNGTKTLLHEFEEYDVNKLFVNVGDSFKNINTSEDYQSLVRIRKIKKIRGDKMKTIEKIYNYDNISPEEIDEKTTRARAILINSKNEVLMCYSNGLQHYEFPGGHLEENETLEEGLKREILEETGIFLDKEKIDLFYAIKYYCKNYHDSGKNRLVEIYYYVVYCDNVYDDSKKKLDSNELMQDYECRYINVNDLKNTLIENKKTTKENNSALDDMILIWDEFLKVSAG